MVSRSPQSGRIKVKYSRHSNMPQSHCADEEDQEDGTAYMGRLLSTATPNTSAASRENKKQGTSTNDSLLAIYRG